jgi:hypothetical protein
MGLETTWKEIRAQKIYEYVNEEENARLES